MRRGHASRALQRLSSHRNTPLENLRATPALREHRLYQVDYLLRDYGFAPREVVYDAHGNLPLANDPKTAWALAHPEHFPVEVRTAAREQLLRVPGIGPASARRIVGERASDVCAGSRTCAPGRRHHARRRFSHARRTRLQSVRWSEQLGFWRPDEEAGAYHIQYDVSPGTFR